MSWKNTAYTNLERYFEKWTGEYDPPAVRGKFVWPRLSVVVLTCVGCFAQMIFTTEISTNVPEPFVFLASLGASSVLMFGAPLSPLAQPRNMIGGQVLAAIIGNACRLLIRNQMGTPIVSVPVSVTLTMLASHYLFMINPPSGGTAAIVAYGSPDIEKRNWRVVYAAFVFPLVFVVIACILINLHPKMRYPKYWIRPRRTESRAELRKKKAMEEEQQRQKQQQLLEKRDGENGGPPSAIPSSGNDLIYKDPTTPRVAPHDEHGRSMTGIAPIDKVDRFGDTVVHGIEKGITEMFTPHSAPGETSEMGLESQRAGGGKGEDNGKGEGSEEDLMEAGRKTSAQGAELTEGGLSRTTTTTVTTTSEKPSSSASAPYSEDEEEVIQGADQPFEGRVMITNELTLSEEGNKDLDALGGGLSLV